MNCDCGKMAKQIPGQHVGGYRVLECKTCGRFIHVAGRNRFYWKEQDMRGKHLRFQDMTQAMSAPTVAGSDSTRITSMRFPPLISGARR